MTKVLLYLKEIKTTSFPKGRLQNQKTVKLGTEGFPKCPNPYFEPEIQHNFFQIVMYH